MRKLSKQSPITLVELPATQYGILNGDVSYDIYSKFRLPSRAIHVLEGILRYDGWENIQSINPFHHGKNGKLTSENLNRIFNSDALLISSITRTSPQSMELAKNYKLVNSEGIAIAGGFDPTFRVEDWLRCVDIVVMKEGEKTISELMGRLIEDPNNLNDVRGLAFKKRKGVEETEPRGLLTSEELSQLPHPFYDRDSRKKISTGAIETSRGCPNNCDFCTVTNFYGGKYRVKSIDYIIKGIRQIYKYGMGIRLFFLDDTFAANTSHSIRLLDTMTELGLNKKYSVAQVTVKIAEYPKLLQALKNAGVEPLCIGIESIIDETLRDYGKPYTARQNKEAIKILKEQGFWVHGMMMPGGDGDTPEILKETVEWANQNLDSIQLFPPLPLPGTGLFNKMQEQGRILTKDWSLYDGQHVVIRPEHFTPYELQKSITDIYEDFYSYKNTFWRLKDSPNKKVTLGILFYTQLKKGLKKTLEAPQSKQHLEFLKSLS